MPLGHFLPWLAGFRKDLSPSIAKSIRPTLSDELQEFRQWTPRT